jgi:outer membrane protein TolC
MKKLSLILMMSLTIIFILSGVIQSRAEVQASLNINDYLLQVAGSNPAYRAAQDGYEGAKKRNNEKNVVYLPEITFMYQDGVNEAPTYTPNINGTRTNNSQYEVGIEKDFSIGTSVKLSYGRTYRDTIGADSTFVPNPEYYAAAPAIEVTQPLWRNGFGSEIRAQSTQIGAAQKISFYQERLRLDGIRIEAEATYNALFFAREILRARRESYDVNNKLFNWMRGRAANELAEGADLVQARAAKELSELQVLEAEENERTAVAAFNTMRGINSSEVKEVLAPPMIKAPDNMSYDPELNLDSARITEQQIQLAKSDNQMSIERLRPTLDLYGKYSHNGLGVREGAAVDESWTDDHPIYYVGVRFKAPLFFWEPINIRRGYVLEQGAKDLMLKKQALDRDRDQKTLISNLQSTKRRYELSQMLLKTQRQKLDLERKRHQRGRTTLFQVLQYEQDYLSATLNLIQYQSELIRQINEFGLYRKD